MLGQVIPHRRLTSATLRAPVPPSGTRNTSEALKGPKAAQLRRFRRRKMMRRKPWRAQVEGATADQGDLWDLMIDTLNGAPGAPGGPGESFQEDLLS